MPCNSMLIVSELDHFSRYEDEFLDNNIFEDSGFKKANLSMVDCNAFLQDDFGEHFIFHSLGDLVMDKRIKKIKKFGKTLKNSIFSKKRTKFLKNRKNFMKLFHKSKNDADVKVFHFDEMKIE